MYDLCISVSSNIAIPVKLRDFSFATKTQPHHETIVDEFRAGRTRTREGKVVVFFFERISSRIDHLDDHIANHIIGRNLDDN